MNCAPSDRLRRTLEPRTDSPVRWRALGVPLVAQVFGDNARCALRAGARAADTREWEYDLSPDCYIRFNWGENAAPVLRGIWGSSKGLSCSRTSFDERARRCTRT